jgi:serine/threonine-protein kinase
MNSIKDLKFDHLVGREVGTTVLLKELARGGMAVVFTGYQKTLKRQIAVKIMPKSLLSGSLAELFQQEAELAAILSHPNIIPLYEVGETEDFLFLTMQLVAGLPLSSIIKRLQQHVLPSRRLFPTAEAINIITSVLDALDYAHRQGIVHRDVKPANVLLERHTNRPIITDFGIAKVLRGPELSTPKITGSPVYISPEQLTSGNVDGRSDIYAVGVMLFEMLATRLPLPDYDNSIDLMKMKILLKDRIFQKKPSELNPGIDSEMDAIILKAAACEPESRYGSCREFTADLKHYLERHGEGTR